MKGTKSAERLVASGSLRLGVILMVDSGIDAGGRRREAKLEPDFVHSIGYDIEN